MQIRSASFTRGQSSSKYTKKNISKHGVENQPFLNKLQVISVVSSLLVISQFIVRISLSCLVILSTDYGYMIILVCLEIVRSENMHVEVWPAVSTGIEVLLVDSLQSDLYFPPHMHFYCQQIEKTLSVFKSLRVSSDSTYRIMHSDEH